MCWAGCMVDVAEGELRVSPSKVRFGLCLTKTGTMPLCSGILIYRSRGRDASALRKHCVLGKDKEVNYVPRNKGGNMFQHLATYHYYILTPGGEHLIIHIVPRFPTPLSTFLEHQEPSKGPEDACTNGGRSKLSCCASRDRLRRACRSRVGSVRGAVATSGCAGPLAVDSLNALVKLNLDRSLRFDVLRKDLVLSIECDEVGGRGEEVVASACDEVECNNLIGSRVREWFVADGDRDQPSAVRGLRVVLDLDALADLEE
jgi:hypothetical protein